MSTPARRSSCLSADEAFGDVNRQSNSSLWDEAVDLEERSRHNELLQYYTSDDSHQHSDDGSRQSDGDAVDVKTF